MSRIQLACPGPNRHSEPDFPMALMDPSIPSTCPGYGMGAEAEDTLRSRDTVDGLGFRVVSVRNEALLRSCVRSVEA